MPTAQAELHPVKNKSGPRNTAAQTKSENVTGQSVDGRKIVTCDFEVFFEEEETRQADLILTDPPYAISRKTGFKSVGPNSVERFAVDMEFGEWDQQEIDLSSLCQLSYKALRQGGTAIIFYDLWKLSYLADAMKAAGFKQLRLIEWLKTNPVPLNSRRNYLTNSREIAVLGIRGSKPVFNGEYDNGQYRYPIPNNGKRLHPTQKPLQLFKDLVKKHSNKGDLVIDPFLGSGTTAVAALQTGRHFAGCDKDSRYTKIASRQIKEILG